MLFSIVIGNSEIILTVKHCLYPFAISVMPRRFFSCVLSEMDKSVDICS